jgi:hypothetical protein
MREPMMKCLLAIYDSTAFLRLLKLLLLLPLLGVAAGNSVCVFVHGFEPYFYADCPPDFTPECCAELCRVLQVGCHAELLRTCAVQPSVATSTPVYASCQASIHGRLGLHTPCSHLHSSYICISKKAQRGRQPLPGHRY